MADEAEPLVERDLGAGQSQHVLGLKVAEPLQLGDRGHQTGGVQRGHGVLALHGDRAAGRQQPHRPGLRDVGPLTHRRAEASGPRDVRFGEV
jgi:hypothetical protein